MAKKQESIGEYIYNAKIGKVPPENYTVIAVVPLEGETVTEHLTALSAENAVKHFWRLHDEPQRGLCIVEIFKGHIDSVMDSACWYEHPNASD